MAQNRIHKFSDINEAQIFLNGGLVGAEVSKGIGGLVGLTLTFDAPDFAVTFAHAEVTDRDPYTLLLSDIKAQIEEESDDILVTQSGGRIVFIEKTPSAGTALSDNDELAKAILGFDRNNAVVGKVYHPPGIGGPPNFTWVAITDANHGIYTWE
jgi:hypothetical protein